MSDNAQLPIPKDLIEPYIKNAVAASIMQLMGDNGMGFVASAVSSALDQKVQSSNGKPGSSDYYNDTTYVRYLASETIRKIALETIKGMAESLRPAIEDAVKANLKKSTNVLAKNLVSGMIDKLSSEWSVSLKVEG